MLVVALAGCAPTYLAPSGTAPAAHRDASGWLGLDVNSPIDPVTGDVALQIDPATVAALGVGWVRINFVLGPWSSPEDRTPHGSQGLDWEGTYRQIVDGFAAHGIQVYGLVGAEVVKSPHPHGSDEWLGDYLYAAVAAIDRFKDTVRVWESYNEPNNWVADGTPALTPEQYAKLLQELWLEVKHHNGHWGDPAWQVTLVSGPLLSHDLDDGAAYLAETIEAGHWQLAWDWTRAETGSIPLDGMGYHLYVAQDQTRWRPIHDAIDRHLDAVEGTWWWYEGYLPPIHVSEVGWPSDAVGEDGQARALTNALHVLEHDGRVATATVFSLVDFPGSTYGLRHDPWTPKPAWDAVAAVAAEP